MNTHRPLLRTNKKAVPSATAQQFRKQPASRPFFFCSLLHKQIIGSAVGLRPWMFLACIKHTFDQWKVPLPYHNYRAIVRLIQQRKSQQHHSQTLSDHAPVIPPVEPTNAENNSIPSQQSLDHRLAAFLDHDDLSSPSLCG